MTVVLAKTLPDHLDFLVMQPDEEHAIVRHPSFCRDGLQPAAAAAVSCSRSAFRSYTDTKVSKRGVLGPCVNITGARRKALRAQPCATRRSAPARGWAMTLVRDRAVVDAGRNERFALVHRPRKPRGRRSACPRTAAALAGQSRLVQNSRSARAPRSQRRGCLRSARPREPDRDGGAVDLLGFWT